MDLEATQPSTQPLWNLPGAARNDLSDTDDVICILTPASEPARKIVALAAKSSPLFILQNDLFLDTLEGDEDDVMQVDIAPSSEHEPITTAKAPGSTVGLADLLSENLDLALRTSARVRDPTLGFVFGREPSKSDIVLKAGLDDIRISGMHFRIYLNSNGILMVQDTSTNGTIVDGTLLQKPNAQRMLDHGTSIEVVVGSVKKTREMIKAKFIVKLPDRREREPERYVENLQRFLQGTIAHSDGKEQHTAKAPTQDIARLSSVDPLLFIAGTARHAAGFGWNGNGKYNVIGEVGKGAFATVYQVATIFEGIVYAEKRLEKRAFIKNGVTDMKVNNELEIMKRLNHANIVQFYEWYETKHHLHMIMEFVPYGDLGICVKESHFLGVSKIKMIAHQICEALDFIHSHGIVHRDIKPENILVASEEPLIVKLSDFGLSKMIGHDNKTFLKTFCGTLLYCAPEVYPGFQQRKDGRPLSRRAKEQSPYSAAVDIWSFGAVLFYLITSKPPYEGSAENGGAQMLEVILRESIQLPLMTKRGTDEAGVLLVEQMMSIDASSRPTARQCLGHEWLRGVGNDSNLLATATGVTRKDLDTVMEEDERSRSDDYGLGVSESFERAAAGLICAPPFKMQGSETKAVENDSRKWPQLDASSQWELREPEAAETPSSDDELTEIRIAKHDRLGDLPRKHRSTTNHRRVDSDGGVHLADFDSSYGTSEEDKSVLSKQGNVLVFGNVASNQKRHNSRLFGEVTASEVEESGVFGAVPLQPTILPAFSNVGHASHANGSPSDSFLSSKRLREEDVSKELRANVLDDGKEDNGPPYKRSMLFHKHGGSTNTSGSVEVTTREVKDKMLKLHFPLGTLVPVAGSFSDITLKIYDRGITFGRCLELTHVYPNDKDTRVPRLAIDIVFWRAGIAKDIEQGLQWQSLPGVNAMVLTRSKAGIRVNGVKLNKASEETAFNCGRLRTGDVIEVFNRGGSFLRYRCTFFVGDSSAERKAEDKFVVEQNSELFAEVATAKMAAGTITAT